MELKEYSYKVEFSFFDQILKSEKHFKDQMVFEKLDTKIDKCNKDSYFIINLRDLDDRYKVLVKKVGESDINIIQIDKSNNSGNLWGYSGCTFDSDKQKALLNEICHGRYSYYDPLSREEPEEIKRLLQPKKKYIVERTILSVDDIINRSDRENEAVLHEFINQFLIVKSMVNMTYITVQETYQQKAIEAINENSLLLSEESYDVHNVSISYEFLEYDILTKNKHDCHDCIRLLDVYVVKDRRNDKYYFYICK